MIFYVNDFLFFHEALQFPTQMVIFVNKSVITVPV